MFEFDIVLFGLDDLLEVCDVDVLVGSVDDDSYGLGLFIVAGDGVVDDASFFVEEHGEVALIDSVFVGSCII